MRICLVAFAGAVALLQVQSRLPDSRLLAGLALLLPLVGAAAFVLPRRLRPAGAGQAARLLLRVAAAGLLGFVWAALLAQQRLAEALPEAWEARDIALTGVVASLPQRLARGERFAFDVEAVHTPQASVPRRILLAWYSGRDAADGDAAPGETAAMTHPGERWRLTVRLKRPHGNANPHAFDYEAWLLERDLRATGSVRGGAERVDDFVARPGYAVERLRDAIRERFLAALPDAPYLGVLIALAVGDQRAIPEAQWTVFNRTGVTHLMSISGLHVTMVAALFAWLVDALWRRSARLALRLPAQKAAALAAWLAALAYTLLAGFEVPAQRTLYMLTVLAAALVSGRNLGVSRTLLLALAAVLLIDPWAVLATGFWLSFGAVAVLLLAGSARLSTPGGWRRMLARWGLAQWAVTVGSLPLLLHFFQQFSLVSPLANALAIPLVSFVVAPLALVFVVFPWPPLLAVDHWLLAQLMALLEGLADWPLWQQPAPPWPTLPLALAGVFWMLLPRGFPARAVGLALVLPALLWPPPRPAGGELWVEVIDVGQGLAVLVRTAAHTLLYDSGPAYGGSQSNAGQRVVVPLLRALGVGRLDALVLSHRDQDHSGGYLAVQQALPVARLLTSISELGGEPCRSGQSWEWDGVRFALLHPLADDYRRGRKSNNLSCVLRVGDAGGGVLLTADIEAADERALLQRSPAGLASRVLVAPHHGGNGSSTQAFIAAVDAGEVVYSAGYRNAFGHPHPAVVARYAGRRQWRTDRDGALHIACAGGRCAVSAWRDERRRYWYGQ